jgi:uncharacterized delta-60 repeat protein
MTGDGGSFVIIATHRATPVLLTVACALTSILASPARAASGDLDPTFGGDGKVITNFTKGNDGASDLAIQANGKMVAVGRASTRHSYGRFALARYRANGSLDTAFGRGGLVTTNFAKREDSAAAVALQVDGGIVVVGSVDATARIEKFAVARYRRDGTLDRTFGGNGKVTTDFAGGQAAARDVAIQVDGRIVVVGTTSPGGFALARYMPSGALDTSFDGDGRVTTDLTATGYDSANAVAIDASGKIVVAGTGGNGTFALARYNSDGMLDATFSGNGKTTTNFTKGFDTANDVAVQADGRIVAAGEAGFCCEWTGDFGLARYDTDGTLDPTFGGDGKVITRFTRNDDAAAGVAIQANGKIVAAGSAGFNGAISRFALARYGSNGRLDPTFSRNGRVTTAFSRGFDSARAVAIQADGKIVAAGSTYPDVDGSNGRFALARYLVAK